MKSLISRLNLIVNLNSAGLALLLAGAQAHAQGILPTAPVAVPPSSGTVPLVPSTFGGSPVGTMPNVSVPMVVLPPSSSPGVGYLPIDPVTGQVVLPPQPVYTPGSLDAALAPDLNAPGATTNYAAALSTSARGVVRPPPLDPALMARLPVAPGTQPARREAPTAPLPVNPANGLPPPFPPMGSLQPIAPNGSGLPLQ